MLDWYAQRSPHTQAYDRYLLKQLVNSTVEEELTAIFNQVQTPQQGEQRLTHWVRKVEQSNVSCFKRFMNTLHNHWSLIVNYFANRVISAFVEGLNKIKTIKRRC